MTTPNLVSSRLAALGACLGALVACSSEGRDTPGGSAGATGLSGAGASAAGTGGVATGDAGSGGSSSAGSSSAGASGGGTSFGGGAGGGASSSVGEGGAANAGAGGSGGTAGGTGGFWGPNGPKKQFNCPAGPYPDQVLSSATPVCQDFTFAYNYNEGGTWIESVKAFFFSNFPVGQYTGGDIIKYTPGGKCEVWVHEVGCNGLVVSPSGNLLAACQGPRAVMEYDINTKQPRTIASMTDGKMLDSPNDLIARSDGNVYFSNRTAELGNRPQGLGEGLVRIDPMGATSVIQMGNLNGVALSPDETKLHVVGMGTWTLDAAGVPGQKGQPTPGGDGFAVDCAGNILVNGTNSAFGGPEMKTLLIVGPGTQVSVKTATVPGLP
ncbi:MAG TPA: SMP-30/gluconolactonase/LRE family protein [Polyangiaceae bacterium]|nr:SMP-30/gluconolactonase/LRE family protein [Polyangiaceae bacterium]